MSRLRNRIAAEEQKKDEQVVPATDNERAQPAVQEQPAQPVQEVPQVQDQPVQEETEAPAQEQEPAQEENKKSVLEEYGEDYTNQWGKVTPYHILFKDYGDQIARMTKDQAISLCLNTIEDLGEKYSGDPDYTNPSKDAVAKFRNAINKGTRNGMDVLFKVKDFLLASEGMAVVSTIEDALKNPKIAKRVASVFNTLISAHEAVKKN